MNTASKTKNRRILVIDDNPSIHDDFRQILANAPKNDSLDRARAAVFGQDIEDVGVIFEVDCALSGHEGLEKLIEANRQGKPYAVAFVDMRLESGWNGVETIERLWKVQPQLQVVICTAYSDYSWHEIINRLGETEKLLILKKPFDHVEVRQMACSLTEKWELLNNLDSLVQERTAQIAETRDTAVFVLASLAESRDPETGEHLERIRSYSHILAEELSKNSPYAEFIDKVFIDDLYRSSPLHDIGKIGIPDSILLKPGALTNEEFEIMKHHSIIGAEALGGTIKRAVGAGFLQMAADIARYHHEKFDGTGYPDGLKRQEIPLVARIVALADVYDALTSARVYKAAFRPEIAKIMIREESGKHFDPVIVDAFLARYDDFLKVQGLIEAENAVAAPV
ncbi:MAG: two-component system response regulator [Planctomycetes bacterium HGW-Planctomycetes-1]|nr:MAG: two-component system response regulator [Planctomycetes bacterium HGW-Planctomycetes-1]